MKKYLNLLKVVILLSFASCTNEKTSNPSVEQNQHSNHHHSRIEEVAHKGQKVMPFNLNSTHHIFQQTEDGGILKVIAKNSNDKQQILLIQQHLSMEAEKFQKGDYSDPKSIHGNEMPGIKELQEHHQAIKTTYSSLPNGGQIQYQTDDLVLILAVHHWFRAQLADHAKHASAE